MKILSLFDGMACGHIAMQLAGVKVDRYVAYEIDKYAIKTAQHNFHDIEEKGDVFAADFTEYTDFDFLVGGSPCTYWSIAQSPDKRETTASGIGWELFSQYVRALKESKPRYFIYENNKSMAKEIKDSITETFGFEPIMINSALVSAQNRQRLYWVGRRNTDGTYAKVNVEQPTDRGILLKDILDSAFPISTTTLGKSGTLCARYYKTGENPFNGYGSEMASPRAAEPIRVGTMPTGEDGVLKPMQGYRIYADEGKATTTTTNLGSQELYATPIKEDVQSMVRDYGSKGKIYDATTDAKSNTLVAAAGCGGGNTPHIAEDVNKINRLGGFYGQTTRWGVYDDNGKAPTLTASMGMGGGHIPMIPHETAQEYAVVNEPTCVAQRGRYFENPTSRVAGLPTTQMYECRTDGKTNTLTTVQKDNGVAEPIRVGTMPTESGELKNGQAQRIYSEEGKSITIKAGGGGQGGKTGLYAIDETQTMRVSEATTKGYTEIETGNCVDLSMPNSKTRRGRNMEDKSNCLQTSNEFYQYCGTIEDANGKKHNVYTVENGQITVKGKQYPIKLKDGKYIIRKLTVDECKRLQTVPEWYDFSCVSNSQAYKMLGNGWTCEVIKHLIESCLKEDE